MPRSSSVRVSEASVKRAGGWVVCDTAASRSLVLRLVDSSAAAATSDRPVRPADHRFLRHRPAESPRIRSIVPDAWKIAPSPSMVTVTRFFRASAIWQAIVRFQIMSNKPKLILIQLVSNASRQLERMTRWPNRFVSLLRILDLGGVTAASGCRELRPYYLLTKSRAASTATLAKCGRIGTHISDVAVFVQALRRVHRSAGGKAELAIGFLLQRAGREGRLRAFREWLDFDVGTRKSADRSCSSQLFGVRLDPAKLGISLILPVAESKSLPLGMRSPSTAIRVAFKLSCPRLWRRSPSNPHRWPSGKPCDRVHGRRSSERQRFEPVPPTALGRSFSTAIARRRNRTVDPESDASLGPGPSPHRSGGDLQRVLNGFAW